MKIIYVVIHDAFDGSSYIYGAFDNKKLAEEFISKYEKYNGELEIRKYRLNPKDEVSGTEILDVDGFNKLLYDVRKTK